MARTLRASYFATIAAPTMLAVTISCTKYDSAETTTADAGGVVGEGSDAGAGTDATVDAAPAPDTDAGGPSCAPGLVALGRFVTLNGKVNVHTPASTAVGDKPEDELNGWFGDPDCGSGADQDDLAYCQRLWPASTARLGPFVTSAIPKPFFSAGCASLSPEPGRLSFVCCGTQ